MVEFDSRTKLTKLRILRLITQSISFILLNAAIFNVAETWITLPVEQPQTQYSVAHGTFYVMQHLLTAAIFPFIALAVFILTGAILGRFFCGWACPFGLVQDLLGLIPTKKYRISPHDNDNLRSWSEVLILLPLVFFSALIGFQSLGGNVASLKSQFGAFFSDPYSALSPATTLFTTIPLILTSENGIDYAIKSFTSIVNIITLGKVAVVFILKVIILLFVLMLTLFIPRAWCRWFCPTGLIMGRLAKYSLIGIAKDPIKCTDCGKCEAACPMDVDIEGSEEDRIRSPHCIMCFDCIAACEPGAIKLKIL